MVYDKIGYMYALSSAFYGNTIQEWNKGKAGNISIDKIVYMCAPICVFEFYGNAIQKWNEEKSFVHRMKSMFNLILEPVISIMTFDLSMRFLPAFVVSTTSFLFAIFCIFLLLGHMEASSAKKALFLTVLSVALQWAGYSVDIMGSIVICGFLSKVFAYAAFFITNFEFSLSRGAFSRHKKFRIIAGTAIASSLCYYFDFFLLWCLFSILCLCLLSTLPFKKVDILWLDAECFLVEVHQLIKFTCSRCELAFWLEQFSPHFVAISSAIGIVIWHRLLYFNHQHSLPSAEIAVLTLAYSAVLYRSFMRETKQFLSSVNEARKKHQYHFFDPQSPDQSREFSLYNFVREVKCILTCDYINDFWNWLDLLHVVLGMFAVMLIWIKSPNAMAVMATASFFRWWGCLFYLQATSRLSHRSFFSHVLTVSAGF